MEQFNIGTYLDIVRRRIYWIVLPLLVVLLGGLVHALRTEPIYEAKTLILVQPQEVPTNYVQPIVRRGIEERLRTITQQVTSRTNLEKIITDLDLYPDPNSIMEGKVSSCRKNIMINVGGGRGGGSTFEIAFRHRNPEKAKDVANALASNFISENLKIRESQALGTSTFLVDELESVKRKLENKEEILAEYQQKYMGAMPEHLNTNLSMLSGMQSQLEQLNGRLQDARNRRLVLQEQIANQKRMAEQMAAFSPNDSLGDFGLEGETEAQEISALKQQLAVLKRRYTENHPDVRRVQAEIEKLEVLEAESARERKNIDVSKEEDVGAALPDMSAFMPSAEDMFKHQMNQVNFEIQNITTDIEKVKSRIAVYEKRVEETPQREQELITIRRDYGNLKDLYNSLLNRKLEAEIAVSMEKKQKGEQFRILDPAKRPEIPVEPDLQRIMMMVLALGLGLGGGLAYLRELLDHSYKLPKEAETDLGMPVLVSLPIRYTPREEKFRKLKKRIVAASVVVGFCAGVLIIMISFKGIAKTIEYFKSFIAA